MSSAQSKRRHSRYRLREDRSEDDQVEVELVDLDPTLRGYHVAWNYGTHYWLPLLGPLPWAVWQTLLSFCFGERDTCWPSFSLIADIAAGGNRQAIAGRWRGQGEKRRRQPGALEILQQAGVLAIETKPSGSQTCYRFRVLKQPPILTPDQLARLSPRLQQDHAELLARCGLEEQSYPQSLHIQPSDDVQDTTLAAQGTTPGVQGTTPGVQDTTNKYKEETLVEELWRSIEEELRLQMTRSNYGMYIARIRAISFDREHGILRVQAPSQWVADQLNRHFQTMVMGTAASLDVSVDGMPIVVVEFVPRPEEPGAADAES